MENNKNKPNKEGLNKILDPTLNTIHAFEDSYKLLVSSLNLGWQLKEPVLLSSSRADAEKWLSQFILKQPLFRQVCIITSPWTPQIEQLVNSKGWHVDRRNIKTPVN